MRNKTTLMLMEQLVMITVFALASVLCLQMFIFAYRTSRYQEQRDRAVLEAQNAAEALKGGAQEYFDAAGARSSGDGVCVLLYDAEWKPVQNGESYILMVTPAETETPYLWKAEVSVRTAAGELLISLPVAGQIREGDIHE